MGVFMGAAKPAISLKKGLAPEIDASATRESIMWGPFKLQSSDVHLLLPVEKNTRRSFFIGKAR
jgi:hypothetical protein